MAKPYIFRVQFALDGTPHFITSTDATIRATMSALIITVIAAALISALCSTMEAMLYSVPWTYIEKARQSGSKTGELLHAMRSNIDKPIMAVLTLNTIANTAGSALAGFFAATALGEENMALFAAGFTLLILIVGEILPKTLGVTYAQPLSTVLAYPLRFLILLFAPFIWLGGFVTRLMIKDAGTPSATDEDIKILASLSRKAGGIREYEETVIGNILTLDQKHVHEVMTPRTIVFSLPITMSVDEAYHNPNFWHFSRMPVYDDDNEDIVGLVLRRELAKLQAKKASFKLTEAQIKNPDPAQAQELARLEAMTLADLMQPIRYVPESQTLEQTLMEFIESRQHLFAVVDEYGGLAGVISLEDVLEEMLGLEIVDESDMVPDLRAAARLMHKSATGKKGEGVKI